MPLLCPSPPSGCAALNGGRAGLLISLFATRVLCITLNENVSVPKKGSVQASGVPRAPLAQTWRASSSRWAKTATAGLGRRLPDLDWSGLEVVVV